MAKLIELFNVSRDAIMTKTVEKTETPKPKDAAAYKKAVTLGKSLATKSDDTEANIARQMFELIKAEDKVVIANAFMEGANLTPKGAMTYVYNCRREFKKKSQK